MSLAEQQLGDPTVWKNRTTGNQFGTTGRY